LRKQDFSASDESYIIHLLARIRSSDQLYTRLGYYRLGFFIAK
jgi:hypothetical protein